jgi:hypothetical protein
MNDTSERPSAEAAAQKKRQAQGLAIVGGITATLSVLWMFYILGIGRG